MSRPCPLKMISELRLPSPRSLIHVGANSGRDEISIYKNSLAKTCLYIEPIPEVFQQLKSNLEGIPNHYPIQAVCSDVNDEEIIFNVASNSGRSSSIFDWGNHKNLYPKTEYVEQLKLQTKTLDTLVEQRFLDHHFDLLVMDTQGAELKILMGSHKLLKNQLTYVFSEIGEDPLYEGGCTFEEVTAFLKLHGFRLKNMELNYKNWGNALYVKEVLDPLSPNIALNKPTQQSSVSELFQPNEPSAAVNGIKNGSPSFCTDQEINPWWQVDLEQVYALTEIRVYNCIDHYDERVRTLQILLSSDGQNWEQVYVNDENLVFGGVAGRPLIVSISSKSARYVRLQLNEENYLHLDEVEVYGVPVTA